MREQLKRALDNVHAEEALKEQTRDFLARAQQAGQVVSVGEDLPKSFLLCRNQAGRVTVYLSQLSSATLLRRVESGRFETI